MGSLPSDEAVLAYLESKGMTRAVVELQKILEDEQQQQQGKKLVSIKEEETSAEPKKKKLGMKGLFHRFNNNEDFGAADTRIDVASSPQRATKKVLTSDDAPTSAPAILVAKRRASHQKTVAIVSPPTVFDLKEEVTVGSSPAIHDDMDVPAPAKKRSWTPKRIIDAETYREENPGEIPGDAVYFSDEVEDVVSPCRSWTPKRVIDAETYRKENPEAFEETSASGIDDEEPGTQSASKRRSWKPKRVVDAETFRKENPGVLPPQSDDEHEDAEVETKDPASNSKGGTRRSRERFRDFEVDESTHSVLSQDSAASDGLEGRFQRQRSKSASIFPSKTTHGTRRKQPFGKEKKSVEWTKLLSPSDEDDTTAASTRSSQSNDDVVVTTLGPHQRRMSDEIPLESFHCDDSNDYNGDSPSTPKGDGNNDDGSGTVPKRKAWRVKRVIDAETFQREEESRENFRQQLDKFKKQDSKNADAQSLDAILSPRHDLKPKSQMTSHTTPLPSSNVRNVSTDAACDISFQKDLAKDPVPPLVEKSVLSLKDRIGMFSKHQTQPPSFLSAKHMKKLVAKEEDSIVDESPKVYPSAKKPPLLPRSNTKQIPTKTAIKNGLALRQPSIKDLLPPPMKSLDVKKDEEVRKKLQRADSFDRRGRLRNQKSALLNQKSMKKKSVFVPVSAKPAEDLSKFKLPMFSKDPESIEVIKAALRSNFVFDMKDDEMDPFVNAFEQVTVSQGEVITKQGDAGDYFYVVAYGSVACHVNGKKVGSTGQGKTFGEMSLLYTCPRAATVIAENPSTRLFRVDQKSFRFVMRNQTRESEKKKENLLRGIPFLKHLGDEDIHRLSSVMTPCLFETGDYIVKYGERGDSCYVIQDGKVRVTDIVVGNISYEDVNLEAGDYFGEGALISTEPRAASVVAMTKGTAFAIDRATFHKVLGDFVELVTKSQDRHKLEGIKIFRDSNLTPKNLDKLASHLKDKEFKAQETIFKEGARVDNALYLVRQGTVQISSLDGGRLEEIVAGGYFGQEQLLADAQGKHKLAKYTVTVGKDGCVCGVLTLKACRSVFNTKKMEDGLSAGGSVYKRQKRASMTGSMDLNFSLEDLNKERILGEGEYAQVWLVSRTTKGARQEYALKVPSRTSANDAQEEAMEAFRREVMVLQQLHHPFIVDLYRTFAKDDGTTDMMMEAIKGGELWNYIHREGPDGEWESGMSEKHAKFYALCLADALAYIHREQFVFRDLKPENILLDAYGYPKLVDFGFAKYCPETTYTFCGTPNYLAPEIVRNHGHGAGVDHWGLGIVTYEMVTGENPFYFEDMDQIALFQSIATEDFYPLPETSNPALRDFISGLLEKDPVQRLGALAGRESDVLRHKWFDDMDLERLRKKEIKAPWIPK